MSVSLHSKFAAAAHLAEGKFLRAAKNWLKLLILPVGMLMTNVINQGRKKIDPKKT
jgi:hypothetical protein